MDLHGTCALVTGGAVRIGRAICEALAEAGCDIVIHCNRSTVEASELAGRLAGRGARAWVVAGALSDEPACADVVRRSHEAAGRLDILVNNAAVFHKDRIADADEARVLDELRVNLLAPLALIRAFARRAESGRIINLLDRRIATDDPSCIPYLLSKKGLADLTRAAALDLAPRFTVNGVAPGPVLPPPGRGEEYLRDRAGSTPLARPIPPADVARAVRFLAESDTITGQIIFVDGGQHLLGTAAG